MQTRMLNICQHEPPCSLQHLRSGSWGHPGLSALRWVCVSVRRCDTVTSAVMMQYSRDLKGHLASLFLNENINLGKKYVFDIKRTSKEAYDHARRALYNAGVVDLLPRSDPSPPNSPLKSSESSTSCSSCEGLGCQQTRALQEKLRKLKEAMLCVLCCEGEINSAFCPCGHTVCCEGCAAQLQVRVYLVTGEGAAWFQVRVHMAPGEGLLLSWLPQPRC